MKAPGGPIGCRDAREGSIALAENPLCYDVETVRSMRRKAMSQVVAVELEMPDDLARFRLPAALDARLHRLLDRQDRGQILSTEEREEAEGLVDLAELLTLLRARAERAATRAASQS
jgi:hypothetical protein